VVVPSTRTVTRLSDLDAVATTLLGRASRLTRLVMRRGSRELTPSESGLLDILSGGERTIGEPGETEALTQPAVSKLVDRLERRASYSSRSPRRDRPLSNGGSSTSAG
jgi:DNA-binding MarR family transcriptional regulator